MDNDGQVEIIASSNWDYDWVTSIDKYRGSLYVWEIDTLLNETAMEWPVFHRDLLRTGMYPFLEQFLCDAGGPYTGETGQPIQFTGSARFGTQPYTWAWDFGDGTTSTEQNPTHTYPTFGTYTVTLVVTDVASNTATDSTTATIISSQQVLQIGNISGGVLKIKTAIQNIGTLPVNNITWRISLINGFLFLGRETNGSIATLNPGEEQTITSKSIFGFGKTLVQVTVSSPGAGAFKEQNATIFLFFIKMK